MLEPITCYLLPKYLLTKLGVSCGAAATKGTAVAKGSVGVKAGSVAAKGASTTPISGAANAT